MPGVRPRAGRQRVTPPGVQTVYDHACQLLDEGRQPVALVFPDRVHLVGIHITTRDREFERRCDPDALTALHTALIVFSHHRVAEMDPGPGF